MVWIILVQPLLFGCIGIELDFRVIKGSLVPKTIVILAIGELLVSTAKFATDPACYPFGHECVHPQ